MPFSSEDFPNLHPGDYQIIGPPSTKFNCIAWAAGVNDDWWEAATNHYWPKGVDPDDKFTSLVMAYETVGFVMCADPSQEEGIEKIALYADGDAYTHAARQLENGKWTSKMGPDEVIQHDRPENLVGPCYGR